MRFAYALFIVVSLFMLGCSGTPDQVKGTADYDHYDVRFAGSVAWDAIENPPAVLEILVIMEDGAVDYEDSIFVSQLTSSYDEFITTHHYNDKYVLRAVAPPGYTVKAPDFVYFDPLNYGGANVANFTVEKD